MKTPALIKLWVLLIICGLIFSSCGGGGKKSSSSNPITSPPTSSLAKQIPITLEKIEDNIQVLKFDVILPKDASLEKIEPIELLKDFSCAIGKNKKTVLCYTTDASKAIPPNSQGQLAILTIKLNGASDGNIRITNLETCSTNYKKNKKTELGRINYKISSSGAFKDVVLEPNSL